MAERNRHDFSVLLYCEHCSSEVDFTELFREARLDATLTEVKRLGECLMRLKQSDFDIVILHIDRPEEEALEAVQALASVVKNGAIIVLEPDNSEADKKLLKAGADEVISLQELSPSVLSSVIRYSIKRLELMRVKETVELFGTSELQLEEVFNSISDSILILRKDYTIQFLNQSAAALLDSDEDSLLGEVFPFNLEGGRPGQLEIPGPEGDTRIFKLEANPLEWRGEAGLYVILKEVNLVIPPESQLIKDEAQFEVLLESVQSGVFITDSQGCIERMNTEGTRLTGRSKEFAVGLPLGDVLWVKHPRTGRRVHKFEEVFMAFTYLENPPAGGIELTSRDGKTTYVRLSMRKVDPANPQSSSIFLIRDICLEKEKGISEHDSEKLNALGLLASGIGHDFNNILSAVLGNISVARVALGDSHSVNKQLILAEKAALQAKSLTRQLISFVKGGLPNMEATTLNTLVRDCSEFILRGSNVKCEADIPDELWAVEVDLGQISQVINNLIINADQSMAKGGVLKVSLENISISEREVAGLSAGDFVKLSIQDQGVGIASEDLSHIFDPYFTTKEKGNGLGLASTASIVKTHKGAITVDSEVGKGSTFSVYLPRTEIEARGAGLEEVETALDVSNVTKSRILVMDDMEGMMLVAGEILKVLGHEVEFSTHGQEAIDVYKSAKESGHPFDACVFDLTVPGGMGGEEACKILLEYDPKLIAIASSGYTSSNVMEDFESAGFKAVVPKPYRIKEMSEALSRVLGK